MTDAELDMLQDIAEKVSLEGWSVYRGKFGNYGYYAIESFDDAMFIAAAKRYMLELIRELRKARKEIELQKEVIWFFGDVAKSLVRDEVERRNGGAQNGKGKTG